MGNSEPVKLKGARAVLLGVAVVLGCPACGGSYFLGVPSVTSVQAVTTISFPPHPPMLHQLPLKRSGTGTESLGTFALHGNVRLRATCTGHGTVKIDFIFATTSGDNRVGIGPARCQGNGTYAVNTVGNEGVNSHLARIEVEAPGNTNWRIDILDRQPKF